MLSILITGKLITAKDGGKNMNQKQFLFRLLNKLHLKAFIQKPDVYGLKNLTKIAKNKGIVVATTHLSDIDVQVVTSVISHYKRTGMAILAAHLNVPFYGDTLQLLTENNLYGVSGSFGFKFFKGQGATFKFEPTDFHKMKVALDEGGALVIAAHIPTYDWKLPDKSGLGAVFLAQQEDEPLILPVAVDIDHKKSTVAGTFYTDFKGTLIRLITGRRPKSKLFIGKAIELQKISQHDLELVRKFYKKDEKLTDEELLITEKTINKLQEQRGEVMSSLASLLPHEKRGKW